jgi:hypothetical protein
MWHGSPRVAFFVNRMTLAHGAAGGWPLFLEHGLPSAVKSQMRGLPPGHQTSVTSSHDQFHRFIRVPHLT